MMKQIALVSGFAALSACSGGLEVPDLRGAGEGLFGSGSDAAVEDAAPALTAKERLVAAVEAQGCVIDPTTINAVLASAQLSTDDLQTVVPELEAEGRIVGAGETALRIVSANCPAV
ncbi:hypothetical protein SAMN05444003_1011 [Cognatiyoonia sediminum]|uniref:Uncharacterized protein n=1 Tax=Cognatiyoonia sediminum TaxID=1508389 RepID=A0A1M5MTF8_9RHOB|nr:hypothetical protein [Cognatiyoonia sediminum]SHG80568.1 hypothetical protein SAMN05444003_1011 [Cognatiyoonia sediminum]